MPNIHDMCFKGSCGANRNFSSTACKSKNVLLFVACEQAMLFQEFFTLISYKLGIKQCNLINQAKHVVSLIPFADAPVS